MTITKDTIKKKSISIKSNSSSDRSIADDSGDDSDEEIQEKPKDKYACGKCLLTNKKSY